jgi:methionyl-tRNA formyltransferase
MKIAFAGTPEFARMALAQLVAAGHAVPLVFTQPDRPAGRGMQLQPSPVKVAALAHASMVVQPRSLRLDGRYADDAAAAREALQACAPEVMVVAAYGLLLPPWVLELPKRGCLNIHASLLPRWRGAAPIHRAIEAGDRFSGITIMQMDAGLDTGASLLSGEMAIAGHDTTGSLHDKLAILGGQLLVQTLAQLDQLQPVPQPEAGVCYAEKIDKAQARLDWSEPALVLERRIRAFHPSPGAWTLLGDASVLKIWAAQLGADHRASPGEVLATGPRGIQVACGQGSLWLTELQRPGAKRLSAAQFLAGFGAMVGARLG